MEESQLNIFEIKEIQINFINIYWEWLKRRKLRK
jgi:hypothetical protein